MKNRQSRSTGQAPPTNYLPLVFTGIILSLSFSIFEHFSYQARYPYPVPQLSALASVSIFALLTVYIIFKVFDVRHLRWLIASGAALLISSNILGIVSEWSVLAETLLLPDVNPLVRFIEEVLFLVGFAMSLLCFFIAIFEAQKARYESQQSQVLLAVERERLARQVAERNRAESETRRLNVELEKRVAARTAQLEASNRELEAFTYTVSHDLRAPVRAMYGFAEMLIEDHGEQLEEEGRRKLGVVMRNADKMGHLIDALLSLSRINRKELVNVAIDMNDLAREVWREVIQEESRHNVRFELGPIPNCIGDRTLLRLVFHNLLSNALKYSRGREEALVEIGAQTLNEETIYYVEDNGTGFDMRYVDNLFKVFQRLHKESKFEGTGVGLASVKRIIERHGGRVWAEGKVGEGASFYFALPRRASLNEGQSGRGQ